MDEGIPGVCMSLSWPDRCPLPLVFVKSGVKLVVPIILGKF